MNKKLSLGFIGGGENSAVGNTHKIASQMDNRFFLAAGCFSQNPEINSNTASSWGIDRDRVYSSLDSLLEAEKGKLDAVAVLTPTSSHYEIVKKVINLGFPVICEKTLTNHSDTSKILKEMVESNKKFLAVTYNYTGYPMIRELRNMIKQNILGKIFHIQAEMPQETFIRLDEKNNPTQPQKWRLQDQNNIETISLDLGSHLHHLIYFLTESKPLEVFAISGSFGHFRVADTISSLSRWSNGLECNIWYSKAALGYSNGLRIRVFGTKGSAEWYQMDPESLNYFDNHGIKRIIDRKNSITELPKQDRYNRFKAGHFQGFIEAFANYYNDIAECLLQHKKDKTFSSEFVFGAQAAEEGLRFLEAISESAKTRSLVKLQY